MPESDIRAYARSAWKYAEDVEYGRIVAGKYLKLAARRMLDDREDCDLGYVFDEVKAGKACAFTEMMPHVKGEWARRKELIRLEPWQRFGIANPFGWIDPDTGLRRFRTTYEEVARKNAKSAKSAAVGNYMLAVDGEEGAEVYSAATTRDQAKIVFLTSKAMVQKSPDFRSEFGVRANAHRIIQPGTNSFYEALSADASSLDGLNPHAAIIDELHAHKTRAVYDVIETALGAREQPLLIIITTAGGDTAGICYEIRSYLIKVLERVVKDETFFGVIYTIDEGDQWDDPAVWPKANPNLNVSVKLDDMHRMATKARATPSAQNNFKTKRLNVWVQALSQWLAMEKWHACADPTLDIADFEDRDCFIGLDLATKIDIVSKVRLFPFTDDDDVTKFAIFGAHYIPEDTLQESTNSQYQGWADVGHLIATDGDVIDFQRLEDELIDDTNAYNVVDIGYDPWQATQLAQRLEERGAEVTEFRQTVANFSEPMKEFDALVRQGRIVHNGDPVLTWMASNVVCKFDAKDNVFPRKERPENKIDGMVAAIIALGRYMAPREEQPKLSIW